MTNKAQFKRMMDIRRRAGVLYKKAEQTEQFQAQLDFYKGVIDSAKKSDQNTK